MTDLFKNLSEDKADSYGLVLTSSDIPYFLHRSGDGWFITVNEVDQRQAESVIRAYIIENQSPTALADVAGRENRKTFTGVLVAVIILACHIITTTGDSHGDLVRAWGASAPHITHGEWFRAVTALMLHANALHLISNMAGIALFGTAVCMLTGDGLGWLMILLSGFLGNLLNAFFFSAGFTSILSSGHLSIGASTAVFGALGVLAGIRFTEKFNLPGEKLKAWLPLAGGLALLGLLGSGAHTDIMAHLFGFLSGVALGTVYVVVFKTAPPGIYQTCGGVLTIGIIAAALLKAI